MGLQGKSNSDAFVTSFYLKHSMDGITWDTYGDIPPNLYYVRIAVNIRKLTKESDNIKMNFRFIDVKSPSYLSIDLLNI